MNETVLVVDDDEDIVCITQAMLVRRGFEVRVARNGKSALQALAERCPDVVLLDVMMPEMDGLEVLAHIRENPATARTPVILLTAKAQDVDVLKGYAGGADYYITKPFTREQLLNGISHVLGGSWSEQGQPSPSGGPPPGSPAR
jgi:CheY-like chemotaxis protein